jgi:hypothetical protein
MVLRVETRSNTTARCPIATWFITDLTRTGQGINPGLHSDRPRTNRLSHIDIQAMSVCLSAYHNIDIRRVASSGMASDVPSESTRLHCRDGMLNQASSDLSQASPVHRMPIEPFYFMPLYLRCRRATRMFRLHRLGSKRTTKSSARRRLRGAGQEPAMGSDTVLGEDAVCVRTMAWRGPDS